MLRRMCQFGYCVALLMMHAVAQSADRPNWLQGKELLQALQRGGYVVVMRHASSPHTPPSKDNADADNPQLERQLDDAGRNSARALGEAIRELHVPFGKVLVSPTYRARLTASLAGLRNAQPVQELGDGGRTMQSIDVGQTSWLRAQAIQPPPKDTNTLMITHVPNIIAAFGREWSDLADGEALVLHPDGKGSVIAVARVRIEQWATLGD